MCACVRACVHACVRVCVRACVLMCVCVYACVHMRVYVTFCRLIVTVLLSSVNTKSHFYNEQEKQIKSLNSVSQLPCFVLLF